MSLRPPTRPSPREPERGKGTGGRGAGRARGPTPTRGRGPPDSPPLPTQLRRCNTLPSSSHGGQGQERGPRGSIGFRRAVWRTHTQVVVRGQGGLGLPGIMRVAGVWEGSSRERRSQCRRHARELPEGDDRSIDRSIDRCGDLRPWLSCLSALQLLARGGFGHVGTPRDWTSSKSSSMPAASHHPVRSTA